MSKEIIDNETGLCNCVAFRSMWSNPYGIKQFDLSNQLEEVFEEVPAFAVDPDTGKLLNETSQPKLISKGFVNVQEKIQSFAKETDIYSILEKFAASGDTTLINARDCQYGDISELPVNLNDYAQYLSSKFKALDNLNPELAKMVADTTISPEDIEKKANDIFNERQAAFDAANNNDKVGVE